MCGCILCLRFVWHGLWVCVYVLDNNIIFSVGAGSNLFYAEASIVNREFVSEFK